MRVGQDNSAGRGQGKHLHWLFHRIAGIAVGLAVLAVGVLAIIMFQVRADGGGGASQDAGTGAAPAGEITFARDRDGDGRGELSLIDSDGSNPRSIPNTIEGDSSLAWAPNGSHLAFVSSRPEGSSAQIYVSDGENVHAVTHSSQGVGNPVWSPDGQRIAFIGWGEPVPVSDTVLSSALGPGAPPSGIISVSYPRIYLVNVDGSGLRRLSDPASHNDSDLSWSPDGSQLALVRNQDGYTSQIWVMDADGANQHQVSHDLRLAQGPLWSPDGEWIAFIGYPDEFPAIYLVRPDGSGQHRLLPSGVNGGLPDWSPDGRRIAYLGSRDGRSAIFVVNADGSDAYPLAEVAGHSFSAPLWSPDGRWIAFTSQPHRGEVSGPWMLSVIPVNSGLPTPRMIAKDVLQDSRPVWRPVPALHDDGTAPE